MAVKVVDITAVAAKAEVPAIATVTAAAVAVVMEAAAEVVVVVVVVAVAATEEAARTVIVGRVATIPTCRANRVRSSAKG